MNIHPFVVYRHQNELSPLHVSNNKVYVFSLKLPPAIEASLLPQEHPCFFVPSKARLSYIYIRVYNTESLATAN